MLTKFKTEIGERVAELAGVDVEVAIRAIDLPKESSHGDLSIIVPRLRVKGNPVALAKEWVEKFPVGELISKASSIGPYMNFTLGRPAVYKHVLLGIHEQQGDYGRNAEGQGKKVVVDFSSPNIAKPFHAGHLRGTTLGNFIIRLYQFCGWKTVALNYLGDWGKQYGLLAIGYREFGSEAELERDPIHHLYDIYVKINAAAEADPSLHDEARAYFRRMEEGDEESLALWKRFRELSIDRYRDTYARLGVEFDEYSGESQVGSGIERVMELLKGQGLVEDSESAQILDLTAFKLGKTVLRKQDGTSLYLTRDLGGALERFEKHAFDKMIYVVGSPQDLHLKQLFKSLALIKQPYADKLQHINYGLVKGMSTRRGTVVFLDDILEQTTEQMHSVMKSNPEKYARIEDPLKVAEAVAISAIIVQDFAARRIKDYEFDWSRMLSFEGDTGPYLQYAHARLCSMIRGAPCTIDPAADLGLLVEPEADALVMITAQFPDVVLAAYSSAEPCAVVSYAFRLSHAVATAWESVWVKNQEPALAAARLLMYDAARITLGNALKLIGLTPLERM